MYTIGALGAGRFQRTDPALPHHMTALLQEGNDLLLQPFQSEILTAGETSLIYFGGVFSHAVLKHGKPGDYRVQDHHGGSVTPHTPTAEELHIAQNVLAAIGQRLPYGRIDLLTTSRGPLVMEAELIEPALFFAQSDGSAARFAALIAQKVRAMQK